MNRAFAVLIGLMLVVSAVPYVGLVQAQSVETLTIEETNTVPGNLQDIYLHGDHIVAADFGSDRGRVFNQSDLGLVTTFGANELMDTRGVAGHEDIFYIAEDDPGAEPDALYKYRLESDGSVTKLDSTGHDGSDRAVAAYADADHLIVSDVSLNRIRLLNASNLNQLDTQSGGERHAAYIYEDAIYTSDGNLDTDVFQFDGSTIGTNTATFPEATGDMAVDEDAEVLALPDWSGNHVRLFDISTPTTPTEVANITAGTGNKPVAIYNDALWIAIPDDNAVEKYNITDPANPELIANITNSTYLDSSRAIAVNGQGAFVATTDGEVVKLSLGPVLGSQALSLDVKTFMEHGSTQDYQVFFTNDTGTHDVTSEATVQSADTSVITVDESTFTLTAVNDESVNQQVTVNASYEGRTAEEQITVANKTLNNIAILPPATWPIAIIGQPGDTTGSSGTWPGAIQLQWLFVAMAVGAIVSWASANPFMGLGTVEFMLLFGWVISWISDGMLIASIIFLVYASLSLTDIASGNLGHR